MSAKSDNRPLHASVQSVREEAEKLEVVVEIHNETDRTLHYIAEVRAIDYDAGTRRLRLRLSDRGRELVYRAANPPPRFRAVEPKTKVSLTLELPRTVVLLAESSPPSPYPQFEERTLADAAVIEVEIGWSRTPYYPDPRQRREPLPPLDAWEDGTAHTVFSRAGECQGG